ncbi:MAG TPA: hypothetical protein VHE14_05815 [Solirubrobacteraceae bacterium]|nr:hypothetical protein [Solirubrobacteraceae bacterium]
MRFTDFLKATVLISAAAATALAAVTVASVSAKESVTVPVVGAAWWIAAGLIGAYLGSRGETSQPIGRLLASARTTSALPEVRPGRVLLNRLWPLLLCTISAGGLAFLAPQIPAIACGFTIIWALSWRRQDAAVTAIEERDGARFYIELGSPFRAIRLIRTPGFKTSLPSLNGGGQRRRVEKPVG